MIFSNAMVESAASDVGYASVSLLAVNTAACSEPRLAATSLPGDVLDLSRDGGYSRTANAGRASMQSASSETRDCQSGFNLLNALESGFHGHSGSDDIALHVSEQIARLVPLIDGEFSRGCIPFGIDG